MGHIFLHLCKSGNFILDVKYCEYYTVECLDFVVFKEYATLFFFFFLFLYFSCVPHPETCEMSCMKQDASPGSMHDAGCLGLVHWDDPEGWYGEGGGRRVQLCFGRYFTLESYSKNFFQIKLFFRLKKKKQKTKTLSPIPGFPAWGSCTRKVVPLEHLVLKISRACIWESQRYVGNRSSS